MNHKEALRILLDHSFLLDAETKKRITEKIETLSPDEVVSLGKLLAIEKQKSIAVGPEYIAALEKMIDHLTQ